ncbi:MAG: deoxycytidylate deaminase [Peptostreptococcaceae bacterium]
MSKRANVFHECKIYGITYSEYNRMIMECDITEYHMDSLINYVVNKVEDREFIVLKEYGIILADVPEGNREFVNLIYNGSKRYVKDNKIEFMTLLEEYMDVIYRENNTSSYFNSHMNAIEFLRKLDELLGVKEAPVTIGDKNVILVGVTLPELHKLKKDGYFSTNDRVPYNHPSFTNELWFIKDTDNYKVFKYTNSTKSLTIVVRHNKNDNVLKLANEFMHRFKSYNDVYKNVDNIQSYLKLIYSNSIMTEHKRNDIINSLKIKPTTDYLSWDDTFMNMANLVALRSKDPKTKVGCIIVKDSVVLGVGYNGMPRGCNDEEFPWTKSDDMYNSKHSYVVHAEANAILNASGSVKDSSIYVSLFPCNECAKLIIQSGIKEVVYHDAWDEDKDEVKASKRMFKSAGVKLRQVETFKNVINKNVF